MYFVGDFLDAIGSIPFHEGVRREPEAEFYKMNEVFTRLNGQPL
jgi:hypothetical protein